MEQLEGEPADGVVILEFADMAAAREWYFSEDYQSRVPHRMAAAPYRAMLVEGL
jgi:uncharacterized protein (DUF1330 family)